MGYAIVYGSLSKEYDSLEEAVKAASTYARKNLANRYSDARTATVHVVEPKTVVKAVKSVSVSVTRKAG